MNDNEIKMLWKSANEKAQSNSEINKNQMENLLSKAQNFRSSMKPIKIFVLVVGIVWVIFFGTIIINLFINAYNSVSLFFLYSATIQILLTAIAVVVYIYQINLINKIDFSEPVIKTQEKLSKLKISTLNVTKVLFLQLPLWTIFYWNDTMLTNGNTFLWILQAVITISFAVMAVWLFFNINYENRDKKWFKLIFNGNEWQPLLNSMDLFSQINEFKTENK